MAGRIVEVRADPATLIETLATVVARHDSALLVPRDGRADPRGGAPAAAVPPRWRSPVDAAVIVATSGSTGRARGVVLPNAALEASVVATNARLGCRPGDRWVLALPAHHVAGLMVLLRAEALGTAAVVVDRPGDPDALLAAAAEGTRTHVAIVPTQLARLVRGGADLGRFATVLVGGGPTPPDLLERARAAGARVVTSYGMTETCGGCVHDGVPLGGVEVEVLPDGRIRVRGPVLAAGYLEADPLDDGPPDRGPRDDDGGFRADGWFVTGDRGRLEGGRLVVEGRWDDVILSGGENVPAAAVERALLAHPDVADAVVVGVPDAEWGQRVRAIIAPRDAASPPGLSALRHHVRATLPASHAPTELVRVSRVPRDAMGKLGAADRGTLMHRDPDEVHDPRR